MKNKLIWAGIIVAIAIGVIALVGGNQSVRNVGATPTGVTNYSALGLGPQDLPLTMYVSTGQLTQATGTIAIEKNPLGATTTVDFANLNVTVPPSTGGIVTWTCGTTTVPGATPSASLISATSPTSSTAYLTNGAFGGFLTSGGNARIEVHANEYVACFYSSVGGTVANSVIEGTYKFRWNR